MTLQGGVSSGPPRSQRPRVLAFAGSLREGSFNHRLAMLAASAAQSAGADVTLIRLRDYALPLYDADLESALPPPGLPSPAIALKRLFWEHQGLLLACPEYNSSITAVLKNALDWVSRPGGWAESGRSGPEPRLSAFAGKVAGLMSASPGVLGGLRGLAHVRQILTNLTVLVLPEQISVPRAGSAFLDGDGSTGKLADAAQQAAIERIATQVVRTVERLAV